MPEEFQKKLDNVAVVVEDAPSQTLREKLKLHPRTLLFGVYEGVPQPKRGAGYTFIPPDKITIFQRAIEAVSSTDEEIKEQVRSTVLHEIGHHFGMSEGQLRRTKH